MKVKDFLPRRLGIFKSVSEPSYDISSKFSKLQYVEQGMIMMKNVPFDEIDLKLSVEQLGFYL